jgi:hypothetical protein
VARVELGSKDYDFVGRINGKPATLIGIFLQPGANALDVAKAVKDTMKELSARFPDGPDLQHPLRHHALCGGVDPRGHQDPRRGHGAGVPGGVPVPAELARHADPHRWRCRSR